MMKHLLRTALWAVLLMAPACLMAAPVTLKPEVLVMYTGVEGGQLYYRHASLKPVVVPDGKERTAVFAYRADGVETTCNLTVSQAEAGVVTVDLNVERRRPNETGTSIYQHKVRVRLRPGDTRIIDSDVRPKTKEDNSSVEILQLTLEK